MSLSAALTVDGWVCSIPSDAKASWAQTGLQSSAAGVYTTTFPANTFKLPPVLSVLPKMATGSYDWRYAITGDAVAGFSATVTFTTRKNAIDISLGALLAVGLVESSPGAITFDLTAQERSA